MFSIYEHNAECDDISASAPQQFLFALSATDDHYAYAYIYFYFHQFISESQMQLV